MIWAAYRNIVKAFRRGKEVCCFHGHKGNIHTLLPFGDHLISIDDRNSLKIWSIKNKGHFPSQKCIFLMKLPTCTLTLIELYGELHFDLELFPISCAMHPSTYLNKILLGSHRGEMQLWNIHTGKMIYSFTTAWGGSAILTIVQSPAIDVVGVGLQDGGVVLHNLRYDEMLMRFHQEWGPVISLTFRTGKRCVWCVCVCVCTCVCVYLCVCVCVCVCTCVCVCVCVCVYLCV